MSTPRRSNRLSGKQQPPETPKSPSKQSKQMKEDAMEVDSLKTLAGNDHDELTSLFLADIKHNIQLLEKSVSQFEKRYSLRVLRSLPSIRKRQTAKLLQKAIEAHCGNGVKSNLLAYLNQGSMDVASSIVVGAKEISALPEIEVYLALLVIVFLLDQKQLEKGLKLAGETVVNVQKFNRRTLDALAASIYFYYARFYELMGKLTECRSVLLNAQRTAILRHDDESQASLLNLLLRNYLHYNLYDQADKLVSKSSFPESVGNNQLARYMFYLGVLKAIQLEYTEANRYLTQAVRKAPQSSSTAGFQQAAQKFSVVVQLLMGEIPDRSIFRQSTLKNALVSYLHIAQAVRVGDLEKFQQTLKKYDAVFKKDKTYTLILRLRHNVIKTGLRMISISYSRISLKDICLKLHLDSEEDAEYIVAKSIRDGVIDAYLDHEHAFMKSREVVDVYSTAEPQAALHQRITFCLNLHDESVKAMRYPLTPNNAPDESENAKELEERDREIAELMEDEMDEDDIGF